MNIDDKTTDPRIPKDVRKEIMRICKALNKEEEHEPFQIIVTEFEVKQT